MIAIETRTGLEDPSSMKQAPAKIAGVTQKWRATADRKSRSEYLVHPVGCFVVVAYFR